MRSVSKDRMALLVRFRRGWADEVEELASKASMRSDSSSQATPEQRRASLITQANRLHRQLSPYTDRFELRAEDCLAPLEDLEALVSCLRGLRDAAKAQGADRKGAKP